MSDQIALSVSYAFHNKSFPKGTPAFNQGWQPARLTPEQIAQHIE